MHPLTDHIYNTIITWFEYLQLHNCKTVPEEFWSSAYCKELYCNKQRMSKDTWPKLFSNPTEHLTVQHILRAEVLKDRNKLEQSTFVPSWDMTPLQRLFYYQKLFSGSSCHEEAGDFKCGLWVDKLLAPNGFYHVTLSEWYWTWWTLEGTSSS